MNPSPAPDSLTARLTGRVFHSLSGELPAPGTARHVRAAVAPPNQAIAVTGVRRAGKTAYLHQLRHERLAQGAARECLPYIAFDDARLAGLTERNLRLMADEYYARYPALRHQSIVTWCFDEIDAVPGWQRFIQHLMEQARAEVFIAGSPVSLMPKTSNGAPGSAGVIRIYPFSFAEYLRFHGQALPKSITAMRQPSLEGHFRDFLQRGGFPAVQRLGAAEREVLLADTIDLALLRDVLEKHAITSISVMRALLSQLMGSAATVLGSDKLTHGLRTHGHGYSRESVERLLENLETAFLVRSVPIESGSALQRYQARKVYPADTALIPLFERSAGRSPAAALETAVFLELERRGLEVTYVSPGPGLEVDFLARRAGGEQELIQVCWTSEDFGSVERALQGLREAQRLYPQATHRLLTLSRMDIPAKLPAGIVAQPAYEWLLTPGE